MTTQPQTFNLELSLDEINTLLAGLGELPSKVSMGLIAKITNNIQQEITERSAAQTPAPLPNAAKSN